MVVNVAGSVLVAVVTLLSKLVVSYHSMTVQSVLYGISFGFSGCLTTMVSGLLLRAFLPEAAVQATVVGGGRRHWHQ